MKFNGLNTWGKEGKDKKKIKLRKIIQTLINRWDSQNAKRYMDKYQTAARENGWKQLQKNSLEVGLKNTSTESEAQTWIYVVKKMKSKDSL